MFFYMVIERNSGFKNIEFFVKDDNVIIINDIKSLFLDIELHGIRMMVCQQTIKDMIDEIITNNNLVFHKLLYICHDSACDNNDWCRIVGLGYSSEINSVDLD